MRQRDSNERLFERALEAGDAGEELHVSVSDAMWALSHVRTPTPRQEEQTYKAQISMHFSEVLCWCEDCFVGTVTCEDIHVELARASPHDSRPLRVAVCVEYQTWYGCSMLFEVHTQGLAGM